MTRVSLMDSESRLWRKLCSRLRARDCLLLALISEHSVLRKVAIEMRLSQPAVTKSLQELEELFGATLFHRGPRGLVPTTYGSMLVRYAKRFLQELQSLATSVVAVGNGYRGSIRVGVTPFIPPGRLAGAINSVESRGFNYRFLLSTGSTDILLAQLLRQELDCVIGRITEDPNDELFQDVLYSQAPSIVESILSTRRRGRCTLQSLADRRWILPSAATPMRKAFDELLMRQAIPIPSPAVETSSAALIAELLRIVPASVTLISDELAGRFVLDKVARRVNVKLDFTMPSVALIARRGTEDDPFLADFAAALRELDAPSVSA